MNEHDRCRPRRTCWALIAGMAVAAWCCLSAPALAAPASVAATGPVSPTPVAGTPALAPTGRTEQIRQLVGCGGGRVCGGHVSHKRQNEGELFRSEELRFT